MPHAETTTVIAGPPGSRVAVRGQQSQPLFELLPEPARSKFRTLQTLSGELRSLVSASLDEQNRAREKLGEAQQRLRSLTEPFVASMTSTPLVSATHPSAVAARTLVAQCEQELAQLLQVADERRARRKLVVELLTRAEAYLLYLIERDQPLAVLLDKPKVRLTKGETVAAALGRVRDEREALLAQLAAVRSAPVAKAVVIERARAEIAMLAARGQPSIEHLIVHGVAIGWPERTTRAEVFGSAYLTDQSAPSAPAVHGATHVAGPDALALLVWSQRAAIERQIVADIEARYSEQNLSGLTDEQRKAQEAELGEAILGLERSEVALVEELHDPLLLRADTDPRAWLHLFGPVEGSLGPAVVKDQPRPAPGSSPYVVKALQPERRATAVVAATEPADA